MNWYYVKAGQQVGPVTEAEFEERIKSGEVQADTLVWHEGMANWQRCAEVRPAAQGDLTPAPVGAPPVVGEATEVVCVECGRLVARENAIPYNNNWVCASCKPVFFQKIQEGVTPGSAGTGPGNMPADPEELVRVIRERGYRVDIAECVSRAWELLKNNFWLLVGATFLSQVIQQAASSIPFVGVFILLFVYGPLAGGLDYFFIKKIRGQEPGIGEIFSGFGPRFAQLMLVTIIQWLIFIGIIAVLVVFGVLIAMAIPALRDGNSDIIPILVMLGFLVVMIPVAYFSVAWIFALPLVIDRGLNFWPAMEVSRRVISMHWWSMFALLIVAGLAGMIGLLGCIIGVIFTMPLLWAIQMYAYDDIFGSGRAVGRV